MKISNLGLRLGIYESMGISRGLNYPVVIDNLAIDFSSVKKGRFSERKNAEKVTGRRFSYREKLKIGQSGVGVCCRISRFENKVSETDEEEGSGVGLRRFQHRQYPSGLLQKNPMLSWDLSIICNLPSRYELKKSHPGFRKLLLKEIEKEIVHKLIVNSIKSNQTMEELDDLVHQLWETFDIRAMAVYISEAEKIKIHLQNLSFIAHAFRKVNIRRPPGTRSRSFKGSMLVGFTPQSSVRDDGDRWRHKKGSNA